MSSDKQNTERRFTMPGFDNTKPFDLTTRDGIKFALALLTPFGGPVVPITALLVELVSKIISGNRVPTESQVEAGRTVDSDRQGDGRLQVSLSGQPRCWVVVLHTRHRQGRTNQSCGWDFRNNGIGGRIQMKKAPSVGVE